MPRQLALSLPVAEAMTRADFFVSPANALALATLDGWHGWPAGKLVLVGPAGSGKTHLANIWAAEAGAVILPAADLAGAAPDALARWGRIVVEDAHTLAGEREAEVTLFHLHNILAASGGKLLLTAATPPAQWPLALPDLASRMQAAATVHIAPPDDALLSAVMVKLLADRQVAVNPQVLTYCVAHMERSLSAARALVAVLDARALAEGRPITRALAAEVLDNPGTNGHDPSSARYNETR